MKFGIMVPSLIVSSVVSLLLPLPVFAADTAAVPTNANPGDIKWTAGPPFLPQGVQLAVLYGDPGKAGPFTIRLNMPAGYKIPPHWHSQDENVTVISGTLNLGTGDKLDTGKTQVIQAGGFHHIPAKVHHYAFPSGPAIVQIHGVGPFDITYINPDDDPRKAIAK